MTIPEFTDSVIKFIESFKGNIFSDKGFDMLIENLKGNAENLGISLATNYIYAVYFGANDKTQLNLSKKQYNSVRFCRGKEYDFILPEEYEYGDLNYGTLIDNKIISRASANYSLSRGLEVIDISINTLEDYRQMGYAVSNVVSLAECLLCDCEGVREVTYSTNSINISSQKTAISAGFVEIAKEFIICCRKIV